MSTLQFIGVGSAFTKPLPGPDGRIDMNQCDWQSNMLVHADSGKKLLIDCGGNASFALLQLGLRFVDLDGVYISHQHGDHIGGLEEFAFSTYFSDRRLKLYCSSSIAGPLWTQSLRGGLDSIEGKRMELTDYFDVRRVRKNGFFEWEGIRFELIQTVHIMADKSIKSSYGLMICQSGRKVFLTTDTQFCPNQIHKFYEEADLILHDCETAAFRSGVHAHYDDLKGLDPALKAKMHLYHYQPGALAQRDAVGDGFAGFVLKHQSFSLRDDANVVTAQAA